MLFLLAGCAICHGLMTSNTQVPTNPVAEVGPWGQCGGENYNGPTKCVLGYSCENDKCVPAPPGPGELQSYSQCGGKDYQGPIQCKLGDKCVELSVWFSMCKPVEHTATDPSSKINVSTNDSHIAGLKKLLQPIATIVSVLGSSLNTSQTPHSLMTEDASVVESNRLIAVAAGAEVGPWDQCGGTNYKGSTVCVAGFTCQIQFINDYFRYDQCMPTSPNPDELQTYTQCGGIDYKGSTRCKFGDNCVKINDWFSYCTPMHNASAPSSNISVPAPSSGASAHATSSNISVPAPSPTASTTHLPDSVSTPSPESASAANVLSFPVTILLALCLNL
jgi:hypothetical protein